MQNWYDRFSGKRGKLPVGSVINGQFSILERDLFNGHSRLDPGSLLLNDGTNKFNVRSSFGHFETSKTLNADTTEFEILEHAILEYKDAVTNGNKRSFLIPEKLLARFELTPFEELLSDVLKKGHLQEIARRPRLELKYEEHLLPVSRAKKIPSSADIHLASHSQHWQTRTLTGVIPKKILSLESEDELNIYENRVYVKIISLSETYLLKRIAEVKRLEGIFREAINFQNAESIYFELRQCIFKMWGEGFSDPQDAGRNTGHIETTLQILMSMLKKIRGLKNSQLYRSLSPNLQVSLKINMTNVLSHDQHYRHVARLWESWLETLKSNGITPEFIFNQNKNIAESYIQYGYDLIKRTLHEIGFKENKDGSLSRADVTNLSIAIDENSEIVLNRNMSKLYFIPFASNAILDKNIGEALGKDRFLLTLSRQNDEIYNAVWCAPTNFYSLESIAKLVSEWLIKETYKPLTAHVRNLPRLLIDELKTINDGQWRFQNNEMSIYKPYLSLVPRISKFLSINRKDVSIQKSGKEINELAHSFDNLLNCPTCGVKVNESQWLVRDNGSFAINQSNCQHQWKVNQQSDGSKILEIRPSKLVDDDKAYDFKKYGRFFIELVL